jgi:hypothetical protein
MEDLTAQNAVLQAACIPDVHVPNPKVHLRNPEQSHTAMIVPPIVNPKNREDDSHTGTRRRGGNSSH